MVSSGLTFQRALSRAVSLLLFAFAPVASAAEPSSVVGTMPEDLMPELKTILGTALQRSPDALVRDIERIIFEAGIDTANAARYPQLGGNFNYATTETATASNTSQRSTDSGFFYNIGLNQNLFHWGALKNQTIRARLSLLTHDKTSTLVYRDLCVLLRKAYLAVVVEKATVLQERKVRQLVQDDLRIAEARKERGSISSAELEGTKLRLREANLVLARTEGSFSANLARFSRLAAVVPPLTEEKIPDDIPRPTYSEPVTSGMTAALLRDNAKSTLEYEIYDLKVREAEARQKIEAVRLFPKFSANAAYSLENTTFVNGNAVEQRAVSRQTAAVVGYWNFFDGFATRGAKREALAMKRVLQQRLSSDVEQLLQNAQILDRAIKLDAEQIELAEIRRSLAGEARRRLGEEVSLGNRPKGEIERAELGILQAEKSKLEARATFLSRWSEFVALAGDDPILNTLPARYVREKK